MKIASCFIVDSPGAEGQAAAAPGSQSAGCKARLHTLVETVEKGFLARLPLLRAPDHRDALQQPGSIGAW